MTPTRDQIVEYVRNHPGVSTKALVLAFESNEDTVRFNRAYGCVWHKLLYLSERGDVVRIGTGDRKSGQFWKAKE